MSFLIRFLFIVVYCAAIGCSKQEMPSAKPRLPDQYVQAALDELRRLQSYAEAGLNKAEYSERFLNSKASIDVILEKASDIDTVEYIRLAIGYYQDARDGWSEPYRLQRAWLRAAETGSIAKRFAAATPEDRSRIASTVAERLTAVTRSIDEAAEEARKQFVEQQEEDRRQAERTAAARQRSAEDEMRQAEDKQRRDQAKAESARQAAQAEIAAAYSPGGVLYATRGLSVTTDSGIIGIPIGAKLDVLVRIDSTTLKVRFEDVELSVQQNSLTHDPRVAQQLRQQVYEWERQRAFSPF